MNLTLKENIKELNENLTAFPEAESIFVKEQAWLKEHLLPLISVDLGELNSEWKGTKEHLLNPIEPYSGYIGEQTSEYHNEFTTENWLAFRLNEQNQYEFWATRAISCEVHCTNRILRKMPKNILMIW